MASKVKNENINKKKQVPIRQSSFGIGVIGQNVKKSSDSRKQKSATQSNTLKSSTAIQKVKSDKQEYDKDVEAKFLKMLAGSLKNLPQLPHSVVRIFLSSTFSDMRAERNTLARKVYPKLKEICSKYDLDFQVVDMRWGVTEDSQNDHSVEKICLLEVENCQRVSLGPNFVLISGDRYGFRPIPTEIEMEEFEILLKIAKEYQLEDQKLMETWYLLDENAKPPLYVLQPIRSQFPFFGDYSPGCEEPRKKDSENWRSTFAALQEVLRKAANAALKAKKIKPQQLHHYFLSVTECEINKGIVTAQDPTSHVLVYYRQITDLTPDSLKDDTLKRYIDVIEKDGGVIRNEEATNLREDVIFNQIPAVMKDKGYRGYTVPWKPGGINPKDHKEHSEYMNKFCTNFIQDITNMVQLALHEKEEKIRTSEYYSDYQEILHHLHFCSMKCKTFCGQEESLQMAKEYIFNDASRKPFILHAPSGAGKTSVMAMIMNKMSEWFKGKEHICVIRFLGTSPDSINIYDVILSVCGQLADNVKLIMEPVAYRNMKNLMEYFPRFLRRVALKSKIPIVILLDSLDQLSKANDSYSCMWLPTTLPVNVKVILSTLPEEHGILNNLKQLIPEEKCYYRIPALPDETGREIIDKFLALKHRTLNREQEKLLLRTFTASPSPLFLKLLLDEAIKWSSYTPFHQINLANSIQDAISQLFENLENKFGQVITSHALGFITIGYNGITEIEIEDALSCDDEALDDVYRYHNPPVEGIVRIPPVLWARIRYDLQEYLVERISFGKHTLNWYHRQFIETARARYATGAQAEKLHAIMAETFMAEEGVLRDIKLTRRKITIPNADRQVTPKPMDPKNRRKLGCLPYHIIHAGNHMTDLLAKQNCFCNFNFLKTKLSACPLSILEDELAQFLDKKEDEEIQILRLFFSVCKSDVSQPTKLAVNLLSFIDLDQEHVSLRKLLRQAEEYLSSPSKPTLIPVYPGLAPRRDTSSAFLESMEDCEAILSESSETLLIQTSGRQNEDESKDTHAIFNAITGNLVSVPLPEISNPDLQHKLDHEGKHILYAEEENIKTLNLTTMKTSSKKYEEISSDLKSKLDPVITVFNSDTSHFVILFSSGELLVLETSGLIEVLLTTLREETEDISSIVCTNADDVKVFVLGKKEAADKGPVTGFTRSFRPYKDQKEKYLQYGQPFANGLASFCSSEELLVSIFNSGEESKLICMDTDSLEETRDVELEADIIQLVTAKSKSVAAVLTKKGSVCVIDCSHGIIDHKLVTNDPITCVAVSWVHNMVFLGDNQGQITLYTADKGKHRGGFPAHPKAVEKISVLDEHIITLGKNKEMSEWSISEIWKDIHQTKAASSSQTKGSLLLSQQSICSFDVNTDHFVTASEDKIVRVWSVDKTSLNHVHKIGIKGDKLQIALDGICIALDKTSGEMKIFNINSGSTVFSDTPENCIDFALSKKMVDLYILSKDENGGHHISIVDLKLKKTKKKFQLRPGLKCETVDISINANEMFLILRIKCTQDELKEIEVSWKKQGSFLPQYHPYRFSAVDLIQASGRLIPCLRLLSKIPVLGEVCEAYQGNIVMITTRRWVVFWDIPTGKCDQRVAKSEKKGMMYRPDWVGQEVKGSSLALVQSNDSTLVSVGSEDGYFFIYGAESGLPVEKRVPSTKHYSPVISVAGSPDSKWFVSACQNHIIKLWDTKTGVEVFSFRVDASVRRMKFSQDSKYLLILTGSHITRMLVYKVNPGV